MILELLELMKITKEQITAREVIENGRVLIHLTINLACPIQITEQDKVSLVIEEYGLENAI